jgi:hypothetical protein
MARTTGKQYREKHKDLKLQMHGLESRIINRALALCQDHPDIMVGKITDARYFRTYHFEQPQSLTLDNYLDVIDAIETELNNRHPHKQTSINFK